MLGVQEFCVGNGCLEIFACVSVYVCLYFEIKLTCVMKYMQLSTVCSEPVSAWSNTVCVYRCSCMILAWNWPFLMCIMHGWGMLRLFPLGCIGVHLETTWLIAYRWLIYFYFLVTFTDSLACFSPKICARRCKRQLAFGRGAVESCKLFMSDAAELFTSERYKRVDLFLGVSSCGCISSSCVIV